MFGLGLCERRNEEQRYICVGMGGGQSQITRPVSCYWLNDALFTSALDSNTLSNALDR